MPQLHKLEHLNALILKVCVRIERTSNCVFVREREIGLCAAVGDGTVTVMGHSNVTRAS